MRWSRVTAEICRESVRGTRRSRLPSRSRSRSLCHRPSLVDLSVSHATHVPFAYITRPHRAKGAEGRLPSASHRRAPKCRSSRAPKRYEAAEGPRSGLATTHRTHATLLVGRTRACTYAHTSTHNQITTSVHTSIHTQPRDQIWKETRDHVASTASVHTSPLRRPRCGLGSVPTRSRSNTITSPMRQSLPCAQHQSLQYRDVISANHRDIISASGARPTRN